VNLPHSFTQSDVERYKRLRALGMDLSHRILNTAPRRALHETGEAIGIVRDGTFLFDTKDVTNVLMDCCLYDWIDNGKNLVQRYAESQVLEPGTDEHYLLQAYLGAQYRIVLPKAVVPGAGVSLADALSGARLFIMDIALSQSPLSKQISWAMRTIPLGEYWISSGAGLPMDADVRESVLTKLKEEKSLDPHQMALLVVRACLESGAAQYVTYEGSEDQRLHRTASRHRLRNSPRPPGRNERCPCGSGRKYKKCCGAH